MSGSGKTTFVIRLLRNRKTAACRFIFDDENRTAPRLGIKPCYTEAELNAAIASRWVVFNPSRMFYPEANDRDLFAPKRRAFRWFCQWIFRVCETGAGEKLISLPEIWRFCTPDSIPPEFASLMQMGRELGCHVICDTQHPERMNNSIIGATTELVVFKITVPDGLRIIRRLSPDCPPVESPAWPLGQCWGKNILSGGTQIVKVF
jgi:hypothetical protein